MDAALREKRIRELCGCYVTVPTMFNDDEALSINHDAIGKHVDFLTSNGLVGDYGIILAGGAAGDFMTMGVDDRIRVTETVHAAAGGQVVVAMGVQSTSTQELVQLATAAERIGVDYMQVSPPFYFSATEDDFVEYVLAASAAAPHVGIILYNTIVQTGDKLINSGLVQRLLEHCPSFVGLKWASAELLQYERVIHAFHGRLSIIDNMLEFVKAKMLGATAFEVHICNHWPEWGVQLVDNLTAGKWEAAHRQYVEQVLPCALKLCSSENFLRADSKLLTAVCFSCLFAYNR